MDMWKSRSGVMSERLPRYKPEIDEDQMAGPVSEPSLKVCSLVDGVLCMPRDPWYAIQNV